MLAAWRRSLRAKIIGIVLVTAFAALLVSSAALLTYEIDTYRDFLIMDVTTQADILARTSAPALAFNDPEAAAATLGLLDSRPGFIQAAIYTPDGSVFASYTRSGTPAPFPSRGAVGDPLISGGTLTLFHPIVEDDNDLGTVYVQVSDQVGSRLVAYLLILLAVTAMSLAVAWALSLWLASSVTKPVLAVTAVARKVIESRDFSLRARRTTHDEIGVFVDAFNAMLGEVDRRAEALEESNRLLTQESEERRNAEAALRLADQRKDEFLATLAHELRNPLAPMVNAIAILETLGIQEGAARRAHEIIARQLGQLARLVDDLLDVSRITTGKLVVRKQTVELEGVVESAVDTVRPLLHTHEQTLAVSLPDAPVRVDADSVRLAQVLSNLLNNAAKYSGRGGKISLSAAATEKSVRIEIADNGAGMAPETLPRIFDMFSQGDSSVERTQSGLGVGLALAKRLVELHAGTIEASSAGRNMGSVFIVTLPLAAAPATDTMAPSSARGELDPRRYRILLVDDNVDFVTSLSLLLGGLGHEVRIAHDAHEALEVVREFEPEVAFLDLGLPRVSGYTLACKLRELPSAADTVLIALSGWGQQHHLERSTEAGFALHLVKPVELDKIRSALSSLVETS